MVVVTAMGRLVVAEARVTSDKHSCFFSFLGPGACHLQPTPLFPLFLTATEARVIPDQCSCCPQVRSARREEKQRLLQSLVEPGPVLGRVPRTFRALARDMARLRAEDRDLTVSTAILDFTLPTQIWAGLHMGQYNATAGADP